MLGINGMELTNHARAGTASLSLAHRIGQHSGFSVEKNNEAGIAVLFRRIHDCVCSFKDAKSQVNYALKDGFIM